MKKTHIIISLAIVSFVFGSLYYINVAVGKVPQPEPPSGTSVVVYDDDFTGILHDYTYITSFNLGEFKYMNVMAQATGSVVGHNLYIYPFVTNQGVNVFAGPAGELGRYIPYIACQDSEPDRADYGAGVTSKLEVYGDSVDLYMWVGGNEDFVGHLTVVVYFTNYVSIAASP